MAADTCTVSSVDFYTPVSQGHSTTGEIPLGTLFFEPIASQQEIFDLATHRNIRFESVTVNDKWQYSVTQNVKVSFVGSEEGILREV